MLDPDITDGCLHVESEWLKVYHSIGQDLTFNDIGITELAS